VKSHQVAAALMQLANILSAGPNVDLSNISTISHLFPKEPDKADISVSLNILLSLSRVDKAQWVSLINEYKFPIKIRPRDASRDILGKLLVYLEKNAEARKKLKANTDKKVQKASPELMKALSLLLGDSEK